MYIFIRALLVISFLISLLWQQLIFADNKCENYPHWDCNDPLIQKIETFIKTHPNKGIVAFDWDGTLYDEHVVNPDSPHDDASAQSVWYIWGANHLAKFPFLFPSFKSTSIEQQALDVKRHNAYLEGKLAQKIAPDREAVPLIPSGYDRSPQAARFESGMSLMQFQRGMNCYLRDYPPKDYAFKKMLDIVQRLQDSGFMVWIISGSNHYFIVNVIADKNGINKTLGYHLFPSCQLNRVLAKNCYIAGNGPKVNTGNNTFSAAYDDSLLRPLLQNNQVVVIFDYGKQLLLEKLSADFKLPVVLYAGNSNGDYYAMRYTLTHSPDAMGIFVQPSLSKSKKLFELLNSKSCEGRCLDVEHP